MLHQKKKLKVLYCTYQYIVIYILLVIVYIHILYIIV